jgi:hypothetical protein
VIVLVLSFFKIISNSLALDPSFIMAKTSCMSMRRWLCLLCTRLTLNLLWTSRLWLPLYVHVKGENLIIICSYYYWVLCYMYYYVVLIVLMFYKKRLLQSEWKMCASFCKNVNEYNCIISCTSQLFVIFFGSWLMNKNNWYDWLNDWFIDWMFKIFDSIWFW